MERFRKELTILISHKDTGDVKSEKLSERLKSLVRALAVFGYVPEGFEAPEEDGSVKLWFTEGTVQEAEAWIQNNGCHF